MGEKEFQEAKAKKTVSKATGQKTKVEKVEAIYGKGKSTSSLEEVSERLRNIGYDALADLLAPAK